MRNKPKDADLLPPQPPDDDRAFVKALETEAHASLGDVRAYRAYRGSDPDYLRRAKVALGVIMGYIRLRGTLANEESNRLIAQRLLREPPPGGNGGTPLLPGGAS